MGINVPARSFGEAAITTSAGGTLGKCRNGGFSISDNFITHTNCPIAHIPVVYDVFCAHIKNIAADFSPKQYLGAENVCEGGVGMAKP